MLRPWRPRVNKPVGPVDIRNTRMAGIALARRSYLATRNLRHFQDLSISVIDPWQTAGPEFRGSSERVSKNSGDSYDRFSAYIRCHPCANQL